MLLCESSVKTEKGLQSSVNQDYVAEFVSSQGRIWLVVSGLSEGWQGVRASRTFVDAVRSFIEDYKISSPQELFSKALSRANEELYQKGLFAEASAAFQYEKQLFVAIFGDAKAYKWQKGRLEEIPSKNPVLGETAMFHPQIAIIAIRPPLQVLLLSKGAFTGVDFETIKHELQTKQVASKKVENLLKISLQKQSSKYNSSVALVYFPAESFLQMTQKVIRIMKPFTAPALFAGIVVAFIWLAKWSERKETARQKSEQAYFQKASQRKKQIEDSLAQVDKAPDVIIKHKVIKGETLASIARKYNITVEKLISLNTLAEKATISVGQELKVNVKMVYTLNKPQTLEELYKERFKRWESRGVTLESIRRANKPKELKGLLSKGTQVIIPALHNRF